MVNKSIKVIMTTAMLLMANCLVVGFSFVSNSVANEQSPRMLSANNQSKLNIDINNLDLLKMDEEIYLDPWLSFQKLLTIKDQVSLLSTEQQLWWLIRKAQCENLLYFYKEFDQTLKQASLLITPQTSIELQAKLSFFQGLSLQREGGYVRSREYFKKAMELARQAELNHLYVNAKLEMAYSYSLAELFQTSLQDMQEAYVEAFALNDHFLIAMINETYGAIYGYMRENEKSLEYYEKALDTYERLGYKAHIAEAIYGIASTYRYWKKYSLAIEKFKLYQQKISYTPNTNITYFGAYGLAMTLAEQGECQEALTVLEQALSLEGLDDYDAELYKRKASCLIQLGRLDEAETALNSAQNIFVNQPELLGTAWHIEIDKILSALTFARGDYLLAYQLLELYYEKYTNILIDSSSVRVANIRASMELERLEVEKALSSQRIKADQLELKAREQQALQQDYFIFFLVTLLIIVFAVVAVQYINNKKMARLSITDPLSGLFNRRYVFSYLDKLLNRSASDKNELSIVVIDIDDFKVINDTYGHPAGDKVIEESVKIAMSVLRAEDVLGRIGGEEFLCVLPRTTIEESEVIAERIREGVEHHRFYSEDGSLMEVTLSFGIATVSEQTLDAKTLYSQADKALYQAKKSGKNRVALFQT